MAKNTKKSPSLVIFDPLKTVCRLLNERGVKYIVAGGFACILHGLVRTTEDVDVLISPEPDNCQKVIDALSGLPDHAARELKVGDIQDNVVVKVADEIEVDISKSAWSVSYDEAIGKVEKIDLGGVEVPYLSLPDLIRSKETYRDRDRADLELLRRLQRTTKKFTN